MGSRWLPVHGALRPTCARIAPAGTACAHRCPAAGRIEARPQPSLAGPRSGASPSPSVVHSQHAVREPLPAVAFCRRRRGVEVAYATGSSGVDGRRAVDFNPGTMLFRDTTIGRTNTWGRIPVWCIGRRRAAIHAIACTLLAALLIGTPSHGARAQVTAPSQRPEDSSLVSNASADLEVLVAHALAVSPRITAAAARADAARLRIAPAGARPDPMIMAGVQNFPVTDPGFADFMTMKMIGVGQTIPYAGKLSLRTQVAQRELSAGLAALEDTRLEVAAAVKRAYYDLAYLDQALDIADRNQRLLIDFMKVTEARYGVGTGGQTDVLRVRVEAARLGETAVALSEQRRATLATINGVLDRPSDTPVNNPRIPRPVVRAAIADSARDIRFASAVLGARAADSPLPSVETLQAMAERRNPMLRRDEAMIAAQAMRVEVARKEHLPDFDVSLSYGQRDGFSDMVTALVSIPIPLQKGRKQDQMVAMERAELAAVEADRQERINTLRADVARLHAELERDRAQLALYAKAILPQGRAVLAAATAGYPVGRADFLSLLDAQAMLFNYETTYFGVLSEFAKTLAELERIVGEEIVQ